MAWIKSFQELRHHPKTNRFSRFCGVPLAQAIGHLHIFWWSALDYVPDGDLSGLDDEEIAGLAGWEGEAATFVDALCRSRFIDDVGNGYIIHDWGEYAGRLIDDREKKREQDRERAKSYRDRQKERHATVTHDDVEHHARIAPAEKTRGDKRTVDKSSAEESTTTSPASGEDAPQAREVSALEQRFDEFWAVYPKKTAKQAALKAWKRAKVTAELHNKILMAIETAKHSEQWQRDNGQYIPHPATWINGGRWEDEIQVGGSGNYGNSEQGAGFKPRPVTQADMPGFHNALDRYDDNGNEITG